MKKKSITLGVVFCIFILCSLTYQPIVANENKNSTEYQLDFESYDCGCDDTEEAFWDFPITCAILESLVIILKYNAPWPEPPLYSILIELVYFFGLIFYCDWAQKTI
jgi:NADH:ubiquinone oxidoreductase subunit 3 (subunit A)